MEYSKSKAEKLIKEFDYLREEKYYPYGSKGKAFGILSLEAVPEKFQRYTFENMQREFKDKGYADKQDAKLAGGNHWYVKVNISDGDTDILADLIEVLKRLKIPNDIGKIPN
jgi:hypothetical protein